MKWKFFSVLPGLMLAHAVLATDPLYQNDAVLNYTFPANPPPTIDATNFVNNNVFTVTFDGTFNYNVEYYEPWNVRNYTNNGFMSVDESLPTVNPGFQFDTQTANGHRMANSFYNVGTISCGANKSGAFLYGAGQLIVLATNITSPGQIEIGPDGFMVFTGGNVDLTRGTIALDGFNTFNNPIAYGLDWSSGMNTNWPWSPATNLTPTHALSSHFPTHRFPLLVNYLELNNPTPYFDIQGLGTSNVTLRAVFVQDSSPNVSYNVYFSSNTPFAMGGGADAIQDNIVWTGSYVDSATGATATNYLVLDDATLLATNEPIANGIPMNFRFTSSTTPFSLGSPASSAFPTGLFGSSLVTNLYSYVEAQFVSTTTTTNASPSNPSGALTNLPGRIYITANGQLDLTMARITGPNYLSLTATNQFAGSIGASIIAPYSDISIGVTNGFLAVTNLLKAALPNWSGTVAAWSSSWIFVTTNGITNDFRVLLISSRLAPTTLSQVQHLNLYSRTNTVVISDAFNVMSTLYIDATNLTLTTNGYGNGATSTEGELNLESGGILWPSSLPNLHNLTNSGAITSQNSINFGTAAPSYITNRTPNMPATTATGILSELSTRGNVATNNRVTIGTYIYTFVKTITNTVPNQVKIATAFDGSMSNLIAAINQTAGSGTSYSTSTTINTQVTAGLLSGHSIVVTARTNGASGTNIVTTLSAATTNLTWNGQATLSGGADFVAGTTNVTTVSGPYDNFINHGLISDQGAQIYANYFENGGTFANNSLGSFILQAQNALLTNGFLTAIGDVSITAGSLVASNLVLQSGRSLTLQVTNLLTDTGPANGNVWSVGGMNLVGLNLPIKPLAGDLLGTTITCTAPGPNKQVVNTWAGLDYGASTTAGYTNNEAIGVLILDAMGTSSTFKFNGTGISNALYVDKLVLLDSATNFNSSQVFALNISPNMVIYYAQAIVNGVSMAEKLNHLNGNRLLWVTNYAGYFSSASVIYTNADGTTMTNFFNAALRNSSGIDSNTNGIPNGSDPAPFGVPPLITKQPVNLTTTNATGNVTFSVTVSNISALPLSYQWYFNSGALPNTTNAVTTNAVLTLTGAKTNQAGIYSVVVINPAGSVTSSNAVLTVMNSSSFKSTPIQLAITMTNKPVLASVLSWQTITNATNYVVFYRTNFTMTNWLPLLTNTASPTSPPVTMRITDPVAGPMRSYRVRGNLKQ